MRSTRAIVAASLAAALAGCATTEPAAVLAGGPRMIDLYRGTAVEPAPAERGGPQAPQAPEGTVPEVPKGDVVEATCRWGWLRWRCEAPAPPLAACACGDAPSYARTAANELELLFPRLPNPDVFIYVPPHLATELRIPVPGYTTAVPLYDRVEYALPGEGSAATSESEAARLPSEAPSGASPEDTRRGASREEAGSGARPEEVRPSASPEEARPDANPEEEQPGAIAVQAPPGASSEEVRSAVSPEGARSGATPEGARTGVSPEEARPDAGMEVAP